MAQQQGQAGAGYDISASSSDSTTQGMQLGSGTWNVGGGIKLPPWVLAVAIAGGVFVLVSFFNRKRGK